MVFYECLRCGFKTNHKTNFKKHLDRKYTCKAIMKEIDVYKIKKQYNMLETNNTNKMSTLCQHYVNTMSTLCQHYVNTNDQKNYKCKYCLKSFKTRQSKSRHENKYCKEKEKKSENKMLLMKIEQMKTEISKMKSQINIKNNSENTITDNNIQIINFGKEEIDYISEKKIKKLLLSPATAIPNLLKNIHFHPKHPENHNVKLTNLHDNYAKVFKNKSWETINKEDLLFILVVVGKFIYEDMRDEKKLDEYLINKYDQLEKLHDKKLNKIYDTVKIMLFDETKKLLKK